MDRIMDIREHVTAEHDRMIKPLRDHLRGLKLPPNVRVVLLVSSDHDDEGNGDKEQFTLFVSPNVKEHLICMLESATLAVEDLREREQAARVEGRH